MAFYLDTQLMTRYAKTHMNNKDWPHKDKYKGMYVALKDGELQGWGTTAHYCRSVLPRELRQFDGTDLGYELYYINEDREMKKVQ